MNFYFLWHKTARLLQTKLKSGYEVMKISWVVQFVLHKQLVLSDLVKSNSWKQCNNLTIVSCKNVFLRGILCDNAKIWNKSSQKGVALCMCARLCWVRILAVMVLYVARVRKWGAWMALIVCSWSWWYSSLNVHLSSERQSIYRDGSKPKYSHCCVTNSTSLSQTNMLFSRQKISFTGSLFRLKKKKKRNQWMQILKLQWSLLCKKKDFFAKILLS